ERDGSFEFANLAPGEYVVQVYHGLAGRSTEGEFAAQRVVVNGRDVADTNLRASTGSTIAGRVILEGGGKLVPHALELVPVPSDPDLSPMSGPVSADIHDDLTFDIGGINGPRRLSLSRAPAPWTLKAVYANGSDVTDTPLLFGRSDQSIRDLEVVLTSRIT